MADNYIERRMEEMRSKGRTCETEQEFRRRMRQRHEAERLAAERRKQSESKTDNKH